jgi:hypothetical protein
MKREAAAATFKPGDLVDIIQFYNGKREEGSSGQLKSVSTADGPIPHISFELEGLTVGERTQYLIQYPDRFTYENEVLSIKADEYSYIVKPKGKLVIPN